MRVTCSVSVPRDEQTFLINFNLRNERCLAIRGVGDAECHVITIEPMVLEICFDIQVLWLTSMLPERITLAKQGFTVLPMCTVLSRSQMYVSRGYWMLPASLNPFLIMRAIPWFMTPCLLKTEAGISLAPLLLPLRYRQQIWASLI